MYEMTRGVEVRPDGALGTEVNRWRTPRPGRERAVIRLLKMPDERWAVLMQWQDTVIRAYPTRDAAEQVAQQLRTSSGLEWVEIDPSTTHWWG